MTFMNEEPAKDKEWINDDPGWRDVFKRGLRFDCLNSDREALSEDRLVDAIR